MKKIVQIGKLLAHALVVLTLSTGLVACDQLRSNLANLIAPKSPKDALKSANDLMDAGQYAQARDEAVVLAEKQDAPLRGEFAWVAARACAYLGDTDGAIRYLRIAVSSLDLSPEEPMSDPAFQDLRTNVRFLQAITEFTRERPAAAQPQQTQKSQGVEANVGGGTQINMNGNGTEVRAGDVVVKLPN